MAGLARPQPFVRAIDDERRSSAADDACLGFRQFLLQPLLHRGRHGVLPPRCLRPSFQLLDVRVQRTCTEHEIDL